MHTYVKSEPGLYMAGHYGPDQKWIAESDWPTEEQAASRAHWLNGGQGGQQDEAEVGSREWYAGMALQGILAAHPNPDFTRPSPAQLAFAYADAMLAEAKKSAQQRLTSNVSVG